MSLEEVREKCQQIISEKRSELDKILDQARTKQQACSHQNRRNYSLGRRKYIACSDCGKVMI